eukprot:Blabericola_migrator_1__3874@NODE_216_length_11289_cov_52_870166_g183_i0_p9_GENE_NODE_216_length_11289_cov_52_870166_g183_i0NODE_216_length_11289_cov_52_870166_g183_i0_p9_ORF_typecomplete_len143_score35_37CC2LZ/PF16516_5/2_8e03CC2LZ/PF16516_5/0_017GKAP/PF03359_13/0_038FUSClike/PF12805_7/0_18_NODE_216_length_11289_cov_52_870166_g183_i067917219
MSQNAQIQDLRSRLSRKLLSNVVTFDPSPATTSESVPALDPPTLVQCPTCASQSQKAHAQVTHTQQVSPHPKLEKLKAERSQSSALKDFKDISGQMNQPLKDLAYYTRLVQILRHDLEVERQEKEAYKAECLRLSDDIEATK